MKDFHVHTNLSHDGISSMQEYINISKEKNIDEITFTEHYDIYDNINTNLKTINLDNYYQEYLKYKDNNHVKINFGIEIGLQPHIFNMINSIVNKHDFDFIIGSSHITCKKDMSVDKSFFIGLTRREAYLKYFNEVLENIILYNNEFDVYGHLDYVVRYGGYSEKSLDYIEFKDIIDEILITLINKNKGIEVNTSGIRYGLGTFHPNIDIIKRYKELGGKIITIGSDAHKTSDLGRDLILVLDMLEIIGFDSITIFHNRKPEFLKIKDIK
ncbi:MAG: histidinol-phosphatase HisJ family protein [Bacilli bacterium]|jgi:histidinol-phosphatase (PHP family)